jgi:SAM-dependent methyltransferase
MDAGQQSKERTLDITLEEKFPLCEGYHTPSASIYGLIKAALGDSIPKVNNGGAVLDLGCSTAWGTIELANLYNPDVCVVGIDLSKPVIESAYESLKEAKRGLVPQYYDKIYGLNNTPCRIKGLRLPSYLLMADGFNAPFADSTFDAVFCMNNLYYALPHMKHSSVKQRLQQVARLVKPGGSLVMSGIFKSDYIVQGTIFIHYMEHIILTKEGERLLHPAENYIGPRSRLTEILEAI